MYRKGAATLGIAGYSKGDLLFSIIKNLNKVISEVNEISDTEIIFVITVS